MTAMLETVSMTLASHNLVNVVCAVLIAVTFLVVGRLSSDASCGTPFYLGIAEYTPISEVENPSPTSGVSSTSGVAGSVADELLVEKSYPNLENVPHFNLMQGKWILPQNSTSRVWQDSDLCKAPLECPTAAMKSMPNSTRQALNNLWVYFLGDSVSRRMAAFLRYKFLNMTSESVKKEHKTFQECPKQVGRNPYVPPPGTNRCYLNENICHYDLVYGDYKMKLTKDWKHFIYEDYDDWLFAAGMQKLQKEHGRIPDVLVISTGLHSCFHFEDRKWWSKHIRHVDALFRLILEVKLKPRLVLFLDGSVHLNERDPAWMNGKKSNSGPTTSATKQRQALENNKDKKPSVKSQSKAQKGPPPESKCSIFMNEYIKSKAAEVVRQNLGTAPWFGFISQSNLTREAPREYWAGPIRMHLEEPAILVKLAYILKVISSATATIRGSA